MVAQAHGVDLAAARRSPLCPSPPLPPSSAEQAWVLREVCASASVQAFSSRQVPLSAREVAFSRVWRHAAALMCACGVATHERGRAFLPGSSRRNHGPDPLARPRRVAHNNSPACESLGYTHLPWAAVAANAQERSRARELARRIRPCAEAARAARCRCRSRPADGAGTRARGTRGQAPGEARHIRTRLACGERTRTPARTRRRPQGAAAACSISAGRAAAQMWLLRCRSRRRRRRRCRAADSALSLSRSSAAARPNASACRLAKSVHLLALNCPRRKWADGTPRRGERVCASGSRACALLATLCRQACSV
jgi:hypothetical protein